MIVQCNQCGTKFKVDETRVGPQGAKVRCTKCRNVFSVQAPSAKPAAPASPKAPASPAPAPVDDDDFGNKTQMYKSDSLSGELMLQARSAAPAGTHKAQPPSKPAAQPASPKAAAPAPPGRPKAPAPKPQPLPDESSGEKTSVVDTSAYLKGMRIPELPEADPHDVATKVGRIDALNLTSIAEEPGEAPSGEAAGVEVTVARGKAPPPEEPARPAPVERERERERPAPRRDDPFAAPSATQAAMAPQEVISQASMVRGQRMNRVLAAGAGAVLILGFAFYGFSERIYGGVRNALGLLPDIQMDPQDLQGVRLLRMRSMLYPLKNGAAALLVAGEAMNLSDQPQTDVDVVVELRDREGKPAKTTTVPLGMTFDLESVVSAPSQAAWQEAIIDWRRKNPATVPPAVATPFLAVLIDPPSPVAEYSQNIHLAPSQPLPPAAVVEPPPAPPPVAPVPAAPPPVVENKDKDKHGKTARTRPKKTHKGSRRATDD